MNRTISVRMKELPEVNLECGCIPGEVCCQAATDVSRRLRDLVPGALMDGDWAEFDRHRKWLLYHHFSGVMSSPRDMTEVRKALTKRYLVAREGLPSLDGGKTVMTGYMSDDPSVRLRATDDGAWVQIWRASDPSRYFELPVPMEEAESMMDMCLRRTTRTTWDVRHGGRTWRVSEYSGRHSGLWTAFLELESRSDGYEEPPWVGRNVSGDRRFTDEGLSRLQRPPV